jgi:hypothetical protein
MTDEQAARALYSLKIPNSFHPKLFEVAKRLDQPSVSSRSCLFGVGQFLSVEADLGNFSELHSFSDDDDFDPFEFPRDDVNYDVITKTPLDRYSPEVAVALRICTRCSGLVEKRHLDLNPVSGVPIRDRRWRAWLRPWENRCFCGGFWASNTGY